MLTIWLDVWFIHLFFSCSQIHKVFHSGVAAQEGSIREGDQVLSINGTALGGHAHWEALKVLRRAKSREMGVVVLKKPPVCGMSNGSALTVNPGQTPTQVTEIGECIQGKRLVLHAKIMN